MTRPPYNLDGNCDILSIVHLEEGREMKNRNYYTRFHMILEIFSWVLMLASLLIAIIGSVTMEGPIAIHFDGKGNPNGYGSPASMLLLPIIMMVTNGSVSLIGHFMDPSTWNMPFKVNYLRRNIVYRDMMSMLFMIELELAVFVLGFTLMTFFQKMKGVGLFSTLFAVALLGTIIVWCVVAYRHNKI